MRFSARFAAAVLALTLAGAAPAIQFSDAQLADLKRVSDYLNGVQTIKGDFMQINPDGTSDQGVFYVKKPGMARFEYAQPNPNLIVSNGDVFAIQNRKLHTVQQFPAFASPLKILLDNGLDLDKDTHISSVRTEPGLLIVTARQTHGPAQGEITLTFSDPGLELRQWDLIDAQGLKTTIIMNNVETGMDIPRQFFAIPQELPPYMRHSK